MATVTTEELQQPWVERPVEAAVKKPPVKVWAVLGALILAFQFYVWGKWITGPYFERVPSGPTEMPHAMKVFQNVYTALGIVAMLAFFYWLLIRPWRRERRVTTDGLLALMWFFLYFQDPIMNYFAHKFTYNSYLLNFGSWTKDIPGWGAPAAPGAMLPEPFLWTAPIYVYALFGLTITANWVMRRTKARFPNIGTFGLIGVCFAFLATLDLILE
ncbi:MAG: spirocyclase AveC family protein, partial [Acidimicrobiia bacterium]